MVWFVCFCVYAKQFNFSQIFTLCVSVLFVSFCEIGSALLRFRHDSFLARVVEVLSIVYGGCFADIEY